MLEVCYATLSVILRESAQEKAPASFWSLQGVLYPVLRASSVLYGVAYELRMWLYRKGVYKTQTLPVPVISIGNLTWGGNGKTPMAEYVTRRMLSAGLRPALLVRGTKFSDEAWMLTQHLWNSGAEIGFGANRTAVGRSVLTWHGALPSDAVRKAALTLAIHREEDWEIVGAENGPMSDANGPGSGVHGADSGLNGPDSGVNESESGVKGPCSGVFPVFSCVKRPVGVVVLDDGMQHLSLHRDFEIVMVNAVSYFGNGRLIPSGPLREPPAALRRADAVVLHHSDLVSEDWRRHVTSDLRRYLRSETPVLSSRFAPTDLLCCAGPNKGRHESLEAVRGVAVVAVSGIGCPRSLELLLFNLGATRVESRAFGDHHVLSNKDLTSALTLFRGLEDSRQYPRCLLITTEKDFARCGRTFRDVFHDVNCFTLMGSLELDGPREVLDALLSEALLKWTQSAE